MPNAVAFTIHPNAVESDALSASDAMRHVLDLISLLQLAENSGGDKNKVVWRIKSASTNSPFTIALEASSAQSDMPVNDLAARALAAFGSGVNAVLTESNLPEWASSNRALDVLESLFKRNLNGIGRTDILIEKQSAVIVDHQHARQAENFIERIKLERSRVEKDFTHTAIGSVEGSIISAERYYQKPAFILLDKLSGDKVTCILRDTNIAQKIGLEHNWTEVWLQKQVIVEGELHYDQQGRLKRISVVDLHAPSDAHMSPKDFYDPDFTSGLKPSDYLDKLRDGLLG